MRVFISYQREDSQNESGRINTRLDVADAVDHVFFDRSSIPIGHRFEDILLAEIQRTDVVIAVIGAAWDSTRLLRDDDYIRYELTKAHDLGKLFVPVLVSGGTIPARNDLPADLSWLVDWQVFEIHTSTFDRDVDYLIADLSKLESGEPDLQPAERPVDRPTLRIAGDDHDARGLWVDDHPDNNERERGVLEDFGVEFDLAISTSEALRKLGRRPYDVIVSDMGRDSQVEHDWKAGLTLIDAIRDIDIDTPVIIYAGRNAVALRPEVLERGGRGSTANPFELYELVRGCVERKSIASPDAERALVRGDIAELNSIIAKETYTDADKARLESLIRKYDLQDRARSNQHIALRQARGRLFAHYKDGTVKITADGRDDWVGEFELASD
jgi:CheY-like chemotaxis protein